jgi:hypothetical protein
MSLWTSGSSLLKVFSLLRRGFSGLSPLGWFRLIRDGYRYSIMFLKWAQHQLQLIAQKKEIKQIEKAEEHISEANKIEDDQKRLEEKANAACEMEKALNPNSSC